MQQKNGKIGLPPEIYTLKPAKSSNFEYSYEMNKVFKQPENLIEEIKELIENLVNKFEIKLKRIGIDK